MDTPIQEGYPVVPERDRFPGKLGITAGVLDAGMSSLATFLGGLVAAGILGEAELGIYAVFFAAFNFGQAVANNLVYIPAEVVAVTWPEGTRTKVLTQSIRLGMLPSLAGASAIAIASLVAAAISSAETWLPLAATSAATTFLWPTQDHVRRTLHIADRSWAAAAVSTAHLLLTAGSIGILLLSDVKAEWVPFGALAIANLISLILGLALARPPTLAGPAPERLSLHNLTRSGVWLMAGVGIPATTAFGAATIITFAAGPEILGYAEAARIAAHPVLVLGTGLGYVMGPRIMRSAIAKDAAVSRHNHRRFTSIVVIASVGYALVVGFQWIGNPMSYLVPNAYIVPWLVVATVFANIFWSSLVLMLQELTAARRTQAIALVSTLAAPLQLLAAATAGVTQAFARPISLAVGHGALLYGNSRAIRGIYAATPPQSDTAS